MWYSWILTPFARCQGKTIKKQYEAGCRLFDIRVKLVGGHPTQLAFLLSDNFALQKVSAKDAEMALKVDHDGVLRVTLSSAKDVTAEFHVKVEDK